MPLSDTARRLFLGTLLTSIVGMILLTGGLVGVPMWKQYTTARKLTQQLVDADQSRRLDAARRLADMGPDASPAIPVLVELATGKTERRVEAQGPSGLHGFFELRNDYPLRIAAVTSLGSIGRSARHTVPALCDVLTESALTAEARGHAHRVLFEECCNAIERIGFDKHDVIPALVQSLTSPDSTIRRQAAQFLIRVDRPAALEALLNARANHTGGIRRSAIVALGELGADAQVAVPLLLEDVGSESTFARLSAAESLWKITANAEIVVPTLVELLQCHELYFPRELIVQAIGRIGPPAKDASPALEALLADDDDPKAQRAAADALAALAGDPGH